MKIVGTNFQNSLAGVEDIFMNLPPLETFILYSQFLIDDYDHKKIGFVLNFWTV